MAIDKLRAVAAALDRGEVPGEDLRAWFVAAVRQYETEAPAGCKLDRALGLVPEPGRRNWWTIEQQDRRDTALRELAANRFPDLGPTAVAREINLMAAKAPSEVIGSPRNRLQRATAKDSGRIIPKRRQLLTIIRSV